MSLYGKDKDETIERRIQDDIRGRQQSGPATSQQAANFSSTLGAHATSAAFMNLMADANNPASPYFAQRAAAAAAAVHSPFSHPYTSLGQPYGQSPNDAVAAQLYARQRVSYGYGYGIPGQHDLYAQHQMSMIDRAAAYNAQQRQPEQIKVSNQQSSQSPTSSVAPTTPCSVQKERPITSDTESPQATDSGDSEPSTPAETKSTSSPSPMDSQRTPKRKDSVRTPVERKKLLEVALRREGQHIISDEGHKWYSCDGVPLGLSDDKYWLSELQVFLRSDFAEAFGATEDDIAAPMHGRNKPIALGQVGIRCIHCKNENPSERGQQATSYPSLISGIYNSVQQMLRLHMDCCQAMPPDCRTKIEAHKLSSSSRGGRKQYWVDSAKRLGMVDTPHGIHFERDPHGPLPPLAGPSINWKNYRQRKLPEKIAEVEPEYPPLEEEAPPPAVKQEQEPSPSNPPQHLEDRPLVFPEDMDLISDYLYLTLEQMSPCMLMEADRVGCYKSRQVGFPGLACKHCVGQAGCGRYFPASEASLSQTTTSQTIMNHVRNCRRCPAEIRENLELMKRSRMGPEGKKADKPKHGGRKVFFHRLWCRLQGIPMNEEENVAKKEKKRKKGSPRKSGRKEESGGSDDSDVDEEVAGIRMSGSSEESSDSESSIEESTPEDRAVHLKKPEKKSPKDGNVVPWFPGCVRLTKADDPNWLSEMQCFSRSDLVEVFSWKESDTLEGYAGRKVPSPGQVAFRCVFCKTRKPEERPSGCLVFPENLSSVHTKAMDMLRLHFHSCPNMPEETKETFKTLRGFGAKVADDSQQYWVDSARDIGLSSIPPGGTGNGWGITFRRNPLQPSPCDELDREAIGGTAPVLSPAYLIKPEDRGTCTDQVLLLMRQVKVCTFEERKDRRGGPGARGRDRVTGFPGLCCKYCASKNSSGRYFPVSAKNLSDNTANSLLAHVSSCNRCPEPIKASLAYLSHRSILQKGELSGSWKKGFFKKIWDRLHVERAWSVVTEETDDDGDASGTSEEEIDEVQVEEESSDEEVLKENGEEKLGGSMNALIKAAAIWLTEQDHATDTTSRTKTSRARALPSKRGSTEATLQKENSRSGSSLTSGKRRRVHF